MVACNAHRFPANRSAPSGTWLLRASHANERVPEPSTSNFLAAAQEFCRESPFPSRKIIPFIVIIKTTKAKKKKKVTEVTGQGKAVLEARLKRSNGASPCTRRRPLFRDQRDRKLVKRRTPTMNTSREATNENRTIHVHIVDVVAQKEGGYTVVVQPHTGFEVTSAEVWRAALPGDYRGGTKVDRLWHLYYGEKPPYSPGSWFDLVLPDQE
jgi:hypothetical protein